MPDGHLEKILIIDDDKEYCDVLENSLTLEGYRVDSVFDGEEALIRLAEREYDVVILDLTLPGISGMQILKRIKEMRADTEVLIVTALSTVGSAVESLKAGAYTFITKPIMIDDVVISVKKAIIHRTKQKELSTEEMEDTRGLVGSSKKMTELKKLVKKVAPTDSTILITGPSGTGKELIAQSIYRNSTRNGKPFVKISCAALPETLLESELFGYIKGAFTGAVSTKKGLFEVASGGTLFLDEISEVSPSIQAKLLRALQEKEIKPLGGTKDIPVDVRFITATNKDLKAEIAKGTFRDDLYYRLNVIHIETPPLKERKDDIPLLVEHFIKKYMPKKSQTKKKVSEEVLECFLNYHWPGNIRELENIIERAIILGAGELVLLNDIPDRIKKGSAPDVSTTESAVETQEGGIPPLESALEALERDLIQRALKVAKGVVSRAARLLQIKRTTLIAKMKKLGIE